MNDLCAVDGCGRPILAREHCGRHLQRVYRGADLNEKPAFIERFWSFVSIDTDGCWLWTGTVAGKYGQIKFLGHAFPAHRVSYEMYVGAIPSNNLVCHRCDTPLCVRPDHLFLGTVQDNSTDMVSKGRSSHGAKHSAAIKAGLRKQA